MSASFRLFAALATLSLTAACGTTRVQAKDLAGTWASPTCEAIDNGDGSKSYVQRNFQLTEETWTLNLDAFGDAGCSFKLFTVRVGGPYTLEKDSEKVAGATEGNFAFREQAFTAHVQDLATIVKVEGNQLFFGARPADNDMCTADKRPTSFAALPVVKR
jgi:hypothetical protein